MPPAALALTTLSVAGVEAPPPPHPTSVTGITKAAPSAMTVSLRIALLSSRTRLCSISEQSFSYRTSYSASDSCQATRYPSLMRDAATRVDPQRFGISPCWRSSLPSGEGSSRALLRRVAFPADETRVARAERELGRRLPT